MARIVLEAVDKVYPGGARATGDAKAVDALSLDIADGEFMVFVGPSGCGKSTALRMIAGLEEISAGTVSIGDRVVNHVAPKDRDIAMVFQNYALYPHMSVRDNLAFGLQLRKTPKAEVRRRVEEAATMLGLDTFLDRKPAALSGGQRQRVAMGRAIVREPQAFLMDEPLSNLDAKLRVSMRASLNQLHERLGVTTVYVTHDQIEAMTLGDRVAVLRDGRLQQVDTPQRLFDHPVNLFVAGFIGSPSMNFALARLTEQDGLHVQVGDQRLDVAEAAVRDRPALAGYVGRDVVLGVRPSSFEDAADAADKGWPVLSATAGVTEELGSEINVLFEVDAPPLRHRDTEALGREDDASLPLGSGKTLWTARVNPRSRIRSGDALRLAVDVEALHFFDADTGLSIGAREPASSAGGTASAEGRADQS